MGTLGWAATAAAQPATHTITDMSGATVVVPVNVARIAEQFPAHTVTDILLGAGDRLVAIPQNVKTIPLLREVYPRIASVPELFRSGGAVNMEDLLTCHPDVVSVAGRGVARQRFQVAGIAAVNMIFSDFDELRQSIRLAASLYGGPAKDRAADYLAYFDAKYRLIKTRLARLPAAQRPSVVHIAEYPPLLIDGRASLIDEWIRLAGGTNAAHDIKGNHASITMEQLLRWNPDVVIIEAPGGDRGLAAGPGRSVVAALSRQPGWSDLKAVRTGRVYLNPQGMYPWERYGPEEALQIQWAAKTLHPDLFRDIDMRAEARSFYLRFFHHSLTDAELDRIFQLRP